MQNIRLSIQKVGLLTLFLSVAGGAMPIFATPALTPQQQEQFRSTYLQGCLAGVAEQNIDSQRGQEFCECTLDRLSQLPASKLLALAEMSEREIMANRDFQVAVAHCSTTLMSHF